MEKKVAPQIIKSLKFLPKKELGQHFLIDFGLSKKIVEGALLSQDDTVLEIGPGTGALTYFAGREVKHLFAVEIDPELAAFLEKEFNNTAVTVCCEDILALDLEKLKPVPNVIIGNLPYNIGAPILLYLFNFWEKIDRMILMFQREVACRLLAKPDTKAFGALTLFTHFFTETIEKILTVKAGAFYPRPKVDSAVLRLQMRSKLKGDWEIFRKLASDAFSMRRKKIISTLSAKETLGLKGTEWQQLFVKLGLDKDARAENLSFQSYLALASEAKITFK